MASTSKRPPACRPPWPAARWRWPCPTRSIGKPNAGDVVKLRAVISEGEQRDMQSVPGSGPAELLIPDLGLTTPILTVADAEGDDHGPGSYYLSHRQRLPGQSLRHQGVRRVRGRRQPDLPLRLQRPAQQRLGRAQRHGHPHGGRVHRRGRGRRAQAVAGPQRQPADGQGWEFALWAEGWTPGLFGPPAEGSPEPQQTGRRRHADHPQRPRPAPDHPPRAQADPGRPVGRRRGRAGSGRLAATWAWCWARRASRPAACGGCATSTPQAEQWRFGGAPANSTTHTRIVDVAYPAGFTPSQEDALSGFTPQNIPASQFDALSPDDFAQLPLFSDGR